MKGIGYIVLIIWGVILPCIQAEEPNQKKRRLINIVVEGEPYTGYLVPPATDKGFEFELKDGGEKITFAWSMLAESSRKMVRQVLGIPEEKKSSDWGKNIQMVRFEMKNGPAIEGIEMPDRARPRPPLHKESKHDPANPKGQYYSGRED